MRETTFDPRSYRRETTTFNPEEGIGGGQTLTQGYRMETTFNPREGTGGRQLLTLGRVQNRDNLTLGRVKEGDNF